jgi:carbon storage regulator CsrA
MLVLSRKAGQQIQIGDGIVVTILQLNGNTVRVGIEAPREVRIIRGEIDRKNEPADAEAAPADETATAVLPRALAERVHAPAVERVTNRMKSIGRDRRSAGEGVSDNERPAPARVLHLTRRSSVANLRGFVVPR